MRPYFIFRYFCQFTVTVSIIQKQCPLKDNPLMLQTNFQHQEIDAHVDLVVIYHLILRHNASLPRFLVAGNRQQLTLSPNNPRLGIAGTGGKPCNIGNACNDFSLPNLLSGLTFCLKQILPKFLGGHFGDGKHNNEVQSVILRLIHLPNTKPQRTYVTARQI